MFFSSSSSSWTQQTASMSDLKKCSSRFFVILRETIIMMKKNVTVELEHPSRINYCQQANSRLFQQHLFRFEREACNGLFNYISRIYTLWRHQKTGTMWKGMLAWCLSKVLKFATCSSVARDLVVLQTDACDKKTNRRGFLHIYAKPSVGRKIINFWHTVWSLRVGGTAVVTGGVSPLFFLNKK